MEKFFAMLTDDGAIVGKFGSPQPTDTPNYAALDADDPRVGAYLAGESEWMYKGAVQRLLDATAQARGYDGILAACSYYGSTIAKFRAEANACIAWRDAVWAYCYDQLAKVQAGDIAQPSIDEFIASLPAIAWPAD